MTDGFTICIETDRLIKKGEEILVDYNHKFWADEEDDQGDIPQVCA